jgi:hypothetical protein
VHDNWNSSSLAKRWGDGGEEREREMLWIFAQALKGAPHLDGDLSGERRHFYKVFLSECNILSF